MKPEHSGWPAAPGGVSPDPGESASLGGVASGKGVPNDPAQIPKTAVCHPADQVYPIPRSRAKALPVTISISS